MGRDQGEPPEWLVAIYARLSKNRYGLSTNTAIQVAECREEARYAARERGVKLVEVAIFEEDDISASKFSTKPRPLWDRMLELIRAGRVHTVMSTESERLLRKPKDMDHLIVAAETTALRELYFTSDDSIDLSTPEGIYRARQRANLAERESNKTSQRMRRKQAAKAQEGKASGGHRAFGYLAGKHDHKEGAHAPGDPEVCRPHNTILNPPEVRALKDMAARFLEGWNYKELAWHLNRQGITTSEGHPFRAITVRNMLQRKRYAGIREHKGAEYPAEWEPVFDPETWEKLQFEIRRRREMKGTGKAARSYLLTGLAYCGKCGGRLNGESTRDRPGAPKRRIYYCRGTRNRDLEGEVGCGGVRRNADALDLYITEKMLFRLDSGEMGDLLAGESQPDDTRLSELLDQRKVIVQRLESLDDEYMAGRTDSSRLERMRDQGQANLAAVEREINEVNRERVAVASILVGQSLREVWVTSESDGWKREVLSMMIRRITVNPTRLKPFFGSTGMRFDPSAIDVDWRV